MSQAFSSQASKEKKADEIDSFFGVYLLYTLNPKYKGRTYIGFTVDPERRLKQHNRGKDFGGAHRTSNRGPWEMLLIVHGFPNMISALRFEWAWQHPKLSRRLNHLPPKKAKEKMFDYNFRLLGEMLNLGPWNRLPLVMRWLRPDLKFAEFPEEKRPPSHIAIIHGSVKGVKQKKPKRNSKNNVQSAEPSLEEEDLICSLCIESVAKADRVQCLSDKCGAISHIVCLANRFRHENMQDGEKFLPVQGTCPVCDLKCLWGDIIRKKKGCTEFGNNVDVDVKEDEEDDENSDEEDEDVGSDQDLFLM